MLYYRYSPFIVLLGLAMAFSFSSGLFAQDALACAAILIGGEANLVLPDIGKVNFLGA